MQTQTDLTARTFRSALVGWCGNCRVYTDPAEGDCLNECFTPGMRYARQHIRRVLICSKCTNCFFSKKGQESTQEAENHDCYDYLY